MRSARELLHQLDLVVLLADQHSHAIGPFLGEHMARLALALGLTEHEVLALSTLPDEVLSFFFGPALRQHHAAQKAARLARKTEQAQSASQQMVERVRWAGDKAELDVRLLLGPLLGGSDSYILFAGSHFELGFAGARLKEAAQALKHHRDLCAYIDPRGLHFRWCQGKGRLVLFPQPQAKAQAKTLVVRLLGAEQPEPRSSAAQ